MMRFDCTMIWERHRHRPLGSALGAIILMDGPGLAEFISSSAASAGDGAFFGGRTEIERRQPDEVQVRVPSLRGCIETRRDLGSTGGLRGRAPPSSQEVASPL